MGQGYAELAQAALAPTVWLSMRRSTAISSTPRYAELSSTAEVPVAVPYAAADAHAGRCQTFLPLGAWQGRS